MKEVNNISNGHICFKAGTGKGNKLVMKVEIPVNTFCTKSIISNEIYFLLSQRVNQKDFPIYQLIKILENRMKRKQFSTIVRNPILFYC